MLCFHNYIYGIWFLIIWLWISIKKYELKYFWNYLTILGWKLYYCVWFNFDVLRIFSTFLTFCSYKYIYIYVYSFFLFFIKSHLFIFFSIFFSWIYHYRILMFTKIKHIVCICMVSYFYFSFPSFRHKVCRWYIHFFPYVHAFLS